MKNRTTLILVTALILTAGLGCSLIDQAQRSVTGTGENTTNNNKTLKDRAVDVAVGQKRIGVAECDEVMDAVEAELNNGDDDFVTKAVKATVLNRIKDGIRESAEKNNSNKAELAKSCRDFKTQFERYKTEEAAKKKE